MNEIIEKGLTINPSMKLNPDEEHVKRIMIGIEKKDGHCPCVLTVNDDTICPCKKMREESKCCCKLYLPQD